MAARKNFLGLVNASGEIRRAPLVGMQLLHERAVRARNGVGASARLNAKDLIGFLFRHFAAGPSTAPRCRVALRVFTPTGLPAVKIRHK